MCLVLSCVLPKNVSFWSGLFCNQVRREEENRNKLLGDKKKRDGPDDEMQAVHGTRTVCQNVSSNTNNVNLYTYTLYNMYSMLVYYAYVQCS